jgi:hypothetical protein
MTEPVDGADEPEDDDVHAQPDGADEQVEPHGHRADQRHFPFGIDP